jgi:pimeloyl-ACP methyl ester carboxylesterase
VTLFWIGFALVWSVPVLLGVLLAAVWLYLRWMYGHLIDRIFEERPVFIVPRGQPVTGAEHVSFRTRDGLVLRGCYFRSARPRRGVILFGLEFGSDRWSCRAYCEHLIEAGFDVFTFEPRNQGESDGQPGYEPLQWVTEFEVNDTVAALQYLKTRPDVDPCGVGFFGISKGGGAGLIAASRDHFVRCCVTDGVFGTYSTLVPYMRHFFRIYNSRYWFQGLFPSWYYGPIGLSALRRVGRRRRCRFPHLEKRMSQLAPRPLLMIHGEADTYIKPEMAYALFVRAREPKEFWLVPGAKHNQALNLVGDDYRRRVREFFERHLAGDTEPPSDVDDRRPGSSIPLDETPHSPSQTCPSLALPPSASPVPLGPATADGSRSEANQAR